ncbi:TetR/AcrR family transcriptional regulator [Cellulomonas sp.]|uniref:TetR/AcrR family transcriptional regulator n=1 Tax=Cellulomonas sp. TaxID=40001 RepID=UPI003BAA1EB0
MAPEAVWLRAEGSGIGRPPRHTRDTVTVAAVRAADRDGLAALTMRSVAAELGTGGGSLYRHVTGRDELVDLMVDHVAGEYQLPAPSGRWLDDLVALAVQGLAIHQRHPWLTEVVGTPLVGPHGLRLSEHVLAVLDAHPAGDSQKLVAYAVMNALISSFARTLHGTPDPERSQAQVEYVAHVLARGEHPHLAGLSPDSPRTPDEVFPDVIRRVLRGLLEEQDAVLVGAH